MIYPSSARRLSRHYPPELVAQDPPPNKSLHPTARPSDSAELIEASPRSELEVALRAESRVALGVFIVSVNVAPSARPARRSTLIVGPQLIEK